MKTPKPAPLPPEVVVAVVIQQQQTGRSTVPAGSAPSNQNANVPQRIPASWGPVPSKPSASTGPGGPGVSIPKVGKGGR